MSQTTTESGAFAELKLMDPLLRAIKDQGYDKPTPIQMKAIPPVLAGRDLLAAAQTGSGKTAGFALPLLQRLSELYSGKPGPGRVRALILTPTRELAAQVEESIHACGKYLPLSSAVVFGGVGIHPQITRLKRGVDVLVATPGRLLDLHGQGVVDFSDLSILVLDEADRMLDMGFIHDIRRILKVLPADRQNLMFSATFAPEIRELAAKFLTDPQSVDVSPKFTAAETVEQQVIRVDQTRKAELLSRLITDGDWRQVLIFTRTKHGANRLARKLEGDGISSSAIHGNKSQSARTKALADFKRGAVRALVATDIAARGLDIEQLPRVVNFELPNVPEDYVHRIGRTGRAGASGKAVSLVAGDEVSLLRAIERVLRRDLEHEVLPGFEPTPGEGAGKTAGGGNRGGGRGQQGQRGGRNQQGSRGGSRDGGNSRGPRQSQGGPNGNRARSGGSGSRSGASGSSRGYRSR
ncbi:MAG: DEAD/DEAH box helicase [Leptospirales bacterium]|jgi:ATP-dependent RNA helicase RhlE